MATRPLTQEEEVASFSSAAVVIGNEIRESLINAHLCYEYAGAVDLSSPQTARPDPVTV